MIQRRPVQFPLLILFLSLLGGQNAPGSEAGRLSIFVDWQDADYGYVNYFKTEIPWVDYALDRSVCDVFVLVTAQETGSGGAAYELTFFGRDKFEGMNDTLPFVLGKDVSDDDERRAVVQRLKLGLVRYASRTGAAEALSVSQTTASPAPVPIADRWDHWVFSMSANGYLNGVQVSHYNNFYGDLSANRVTEDWKLGLYAGGSYNYNVFKLDSVTTYKDTSRSYYAEASLTRSLTSHWSVRVMTDYEYSSYSNLALHLVAGPSFEYSFFPYSEATRRELKVVLNGRYIYNRYLEETIYDRWEENLYRQSISLSIDTKQPWGSIYAVISGGAYVLGGAKLLPDLSKNSVSITSTLSLQLVRGLSFNLSGFIYLLHDQLTLPKRGMTPEEILLQIKELSSQYRYHASVGLSYSFGSLYSRVVNTRFE